MRFLTTAGVALMIVALAVLPALAQDAARERRQLLRADPGVEALARALEHDDLLVARAAARLLPAKGADARPALRRALRHDDMLVRRSAAMNLGALGADGLDLVARALGDDNQYVRQGAIYALIGLPHSEAVAELLDRAREDESQDVRNAALLIGRAAFVTVDSIRLPADGWRFRLDPVEHGREQEWFAVDHNDSDWEFIEIEQPWQDAGYDYVGVAWYRRTVELPDREPPGRASLAFEGVDESTWVWVNGEYAGSHDVGPTGWDKPFRIDVSEMLNWGGENQITVRAMNTAHAGGIWRPVSIVLLEPAQ